MSVLRPGCDTNRCRSMRYIFSAQDKYMVNVIVQAISSFVPCFPAILADVYAAYFTTGNNAIRGRRVCPQTADVRFVAMTRGVPA